MRATALPFSDPFAHSPPPPRPRAVDAGRPLPSGRLAVINARNLCICRLIYINRAQVTRSLGDLFLKRADFFRHVPDAMKPSALAAAAAAAVATGGMPAAEAAGFRPPYVSSEPEVVSRPLGGRDLFLVIASDGLWDELQVGKGVRWHKADDGCGHFPACEHFPA
jgi:hypothetical protein